MSAFGGIADIGRVCFTPSSGHWNSVVECPLCARSRHYTGAAVEPAPGGPCALPRAIPHVLVNEEPGSSRIRAPPVRNAFGGHVIGSTARLRRLKFGRESPLKIMKYG